MITLLISGRHLTISRQKVKEILLAYGMPMKIVNLVMGLYIYSMWHDCASGNTWCTKCGLWHNCWRATGRGCCHPTSFVIIVEFVLQNLIKETSEFKNLISPPSQGNPEDVQATKHLTRSWLLWMISQSCTVWKIHRSYSWQLKNGGHSLSDSTSTKPKPATWSLRNKRNYNHTESHRRWHQTRLQKSSVSGGCKPSVQWTGCGEYGVSSAAERYVKVQPYTSSQVRVSISTWLQAPWQTGWSFTLFDTQASHIWVELLHTQSLCIKETIGLADGLPASLAIPGMRVGFKLFKAAGIYINTLLNAVVNTRQDLWLAETVILPPREKCSAQAGLPGSLATMCWDPACEDDSIEPASNLSCCTDPRCGPWPKLWWKE